MGKSPGRWIKTVLFGKKSSKSNISKGREKLVNKKEAVVASNVSENGLAFDPSPNTIAGNEEHLELENREAEDLLPGNQGIDTVGSVDQDAIPDPEKIMLEEAATKAQAAFRGYLARRAFRALKGIIRLQALIRGHLVRRQAVATLCCMYRIVKLQAFVRGRRARQSDVGFEIQEKCNLFKPPSGKLGEPVGICTRIAQLSVNTFILKLLASSTTIMVLHLQYVGGDPNSVLSWLERWSASHFWKPVPQPKKIRDSKSLRKHGNISIGEAQISKSKRTRKLPTANFEPVPVQANPEFEKPKRNLRKISSQPSDPVQENPQSELEKVKRNLRKIHNPVAVNAVLSESETPKQHLEKTTVTAEHAVSEQGVITSKEKIKKEAVSEQGIIASKGKSKKEAVSEQGIIASKEKSKKEAVSEQVFITPNEKIKNEAVSEQGVIIPNEKIKNEETLTMSNVPVVEIAPRPSVEKEPFDISSSNQVTLESKPLTETTTKDNNNTSADEAKSELSDLPETIYKDENAPLTNGDLNHNKEDKKGNENQKPIRKSSISAKQDRAENGLQNSPTLPSYMAATESAKAKLRAQGSPRFGQDGSERNSPAGRHSLPSSTDSKISSHSPRTQRTVQAGGKGGPRSDKPSSRGGNGKVIQAEWRR